MNLSVLRDGRIVDTRCIGPGTYRAGRDAANDIVLDDPQVSRFHVVIVMQSDCMTVKDCGTKNRFLHRGKKVKSAEVRPGESVVLRPYEIRLERPEPKKPAQKVENGFHEAATSFLQVGSCPGGQLVIKKAESIPQEVHVLRRPVTVMGRSSECDLQIANPTVSKRHAVIEFLPLQTIIRDLGSTSGTFVNNARIEEKELHNGDFIRLGAVEMRFETLPGNPTPAPPPAGGESRAERIPHGRSSGTRKRTQARNRRTVLAIGGLLAVLTILALGVYLFSPGRSPEEKIAGETIAQSQKIQEDQLRQVALASLSKGRQALAANAYEDASGHLKKTLSIEPNHEEARKLLAQAEAMLSKAQEEKTRAEQERRAREQKVLSLLSEAERNVKGMDYAAAQKILRSALALDPDSGRAKNLLARVEKQMDQAERQRKETRERQERTAAQVKRLFDLGMAKKERGEHADAIRTWQEIEALDPSGKMPLASDAKRASEEVRQFLRRQSDVLTQQARQAARNGRYAQAANALREATRIDPWNEDAASFYLDMRNHLASTGRRLFDDGNLYEGMGEFGHACAKWKEALKVVPADDPLYPLIRQKERTCN